MRRRMHARLGLLRSVARFFSGITRLHHANGQSDGSTSKREGNEA
jgi:hypothetical protein